jgi:hypothetical protein
MDDAAQPKLTDSQPEIYVPYLPVPVRQKAFLRFLVPAVLWLLVGVSLLIAYSQSSPGNAVWDDGVVRTFTGTFHSIPYPAIYADDRGDGKPGLLLLVEVGKRGAGGRTLPPDATGVSVSGWPLHRDGRWMLELEPGAQAIQPLPNRAPSPLPTPVSLGRVTLRGEIVDSKCFLGAMKPGEGKTHKECATLCISGGIPPMLVTRNQQGEPTFYLLADSSGGQLSPDVFPFIADAVEVTGELERIGQSLRLRIRRDDVKRL